MTSQNEPIILRLIFRPVRGGALLRWESDVLGVRESRLPAPIPASDMGLILRALDALQDPAYPTAWNAVQVRSFSFSPDEQALLNAAGLWGTGRVRADAPWRIGRRLYRALTADAAGAQALGTVRDHAAAVGRPVSLELCFPPDATDLAGLPWELLWDEGPTPVLLGRGATAACVRRLDLAQALPPPRQASGPLRILAVSPRAGVPDEMRQIERAARAAAWEPLIRRGLAHMEELSPVTRKTLADMIAGERPPDIIHYYGHGRYSGGEGALLLDDDGAAAWTPAAALAPLLAPAGMVVLHACQGAMLGIEGTLSESADMRSAIAPALCAAGVPIVLGMQFTVRAAAASRMAAVIYQALAEGRSVEEAVAFARRALYVEEPDRVSWYVPALYLRARSGGPTYLRPPVAHPASVPSRPVSPPSQPTGARQSVVARDGGAISALRVHGGSGSHQAVIAEGGSISGVELFDNTN
ncbi:MAG: CHAT domain-containing protein [Chloroflexales bacterium]